MDVFRKKKADKGKEKEEKAPDNELACDSGAALNPTTQEPKDGEKPKGLAAFASLSKVKTVAVADSVVRALKTGAIRNGLLVETNLVVDSWALSAPPEVQEKVSAEEKKRQEAIYEVISTEKSYLHKCQVVMKKYVEPMKINKVVEPPVHACIFSEIDQVTITSSDFFDLLEKRQKSDSWVIDRIGDLFEQLLPRLKPYIAYCGNMRNASKCFAHYFETDKGLVAFLEKTEKDPEIQAFKGFDLSTFLLEPMQRLTRYPLLVREIIRHTPTTHPDHSLLNKVLDELEDIVARTNDAAKAKDNSIHLKKLQTVFNLSDLEEELILDSETRSLGHREILHRGFLYLSKASTIKKIMTFLFNDILLFGIPHPKPNPKNYLYTLLRPPVPVNEVLVRSSHMMNLGEDVFQLIYRTEVIELKALSVADKQKWMVMIETATNNYFTIEQQKQKAKIKKFSHITGHLDVLVVRGQNLASRDSNGLSDPFCIVELNGEQRDTNCIEKSLNPQWEQTLSFPVTEKPTNDKLIVKVADRDQYSADDPIGEASVDLNFLESLPDGQEKELTLKLDKVECGEVVLRVSYRVLN